MVFYVAGCATDCVHNARLDVYPHFILPHPRIRTTSCSPCLMSCESHIVSAVTGVQPQLEASDSNEITPAQAVPDPTSHPDDIADLEPGTHILSQNCPYVVVPGGIGAADWFLRARESMYEETNKFLGTLVAARYTVPSRFSAMILPMLHAVGCEKLMEHLEALCNFNVDRAHTFNDLAVASAELSLSFSIISIVCGNEQAGQLSKTMYERFTMFEALSRPVNTESSWSALRRHYGLVAGPYLEQPLLGITDFLKYVMEHQTTVFYSVLIGFKALRYRNGPLFRTIFMELKHGWECTGYSPFAGANDVHKLYCTGKFDEYTQSWLSAPTALL